MWSHSCTADNYERKIKSKVRMFSLMQLSEVLHLLHCSQIKSSSCVPHKKENFGATPIKSKSKGKDQQQQKSQNQETNETNLKDKEKPDIKWKIQSKSKDAKQTNETNLKNIRQQKRHKIKDIIHHQNSLKKMTMDIKLLSNKSVVSTSISKHTRSMLNLLSSQPWGESRVTSR